jgi:hypothetical protein
MKQEINKFTAYTNCPSGEYWAAFCNSEVKKYPKGKREILSFLILNDDKETPRLNNKEEPYYSTIICNESKGSNPKSKVSKIKKSMLKKEEYDPIDAHLGLPNTSYFFKRIIQVRVTTKETGMNFITHIQRPRDNQWEYIEGEFEGKYKTITDPIELYSKLRKQIPFKERELCDEAINTMVNINSGVLLDEKGKFKMDVDYNSKEMIKPESASSTTHKRLVKFIESQDLKTIFSELRIW